MCATERQVACHAVQCSAQRASYGCTLQRWSADLQVQAPQSPCGLCQGSRRCCQAAALAPPAVAALSVLGAAQVPGQAPPHLWRRLGAALCVCVGGHQRSAKYPEYLQMQSCATGAIVVDAPARLEPCPGVQALTHKNHTCAHARARLHAPSRWAVACSGCWWWWWWCWW